MDPVDPDSGRSAASGDDALCAGLGRLAGLPRGTTCRVPGHLREADLGCTTPARGKDPIDRSAVNAAVRCVSTGDMSRTVIGPCRGGDGG
ncbi:hypothetical protein [Lentzea jiangxiensis]|uniref:Uncharacterized protein n=1 Tax=Lentzea jiangxiensis TaxID=641025 RepID=A0A1H0Q9C1_9PSEU|nr:hypothetical protein [Lentzea jiangxiensis]SDP13645.1 hypothetical protein SAMN05421507_105369 [Lentzea jiangxiensis]